MIKHVVWWTLQDQAEGCTARENALKLKVMLDKLETLDCVDSLKTVVDILPSSTEDVDILLVSTHATEGDLQAYAAHHEHADVADFVRKVVKSRKAIDFEL